MKKYDIFPTPLWHIEETPQQLIDELYKGAYYFKEKYKSVTKSNEGSYHSPSFEWEEFHPYAQQYINDILKNIFENKIKVSEWWYNINPKGTWNKPHNHRGAEFALVLYLTDTDHLLTLMNPFNFRSYDNLNDDICPQAQKGDIIIFPSDIIHYVKPNQREEERISISMNFQLC